MLSNTVQHHATNGLRSCGAEATPTLKSVLRHRPTTKTTVTPTTTSAPTCATHPKRSWREKARAHLDLPRPPAHSKVRYDAPFIILPITCLGDTLPRRAPLLIRRGQSSWRACAHAPPLLKIGSVTGIDGRNVVGLDIGPLVRRTHVKEFAAIRT